MEALLTTFTAGWASGINAYLAAFLLGITGKLGADIVPAELQRTDVLIVLGTLGLVEIIADKIAYIDSIWDTIQTPVRVAAGAIIGALMAGEQLDAELLSTELNAAVGGTAALLSHLAKSGIRLAVNSSPEPASNIIVSLLGDMTVSGMIVLAVLAPAVAATIAGVLLVLGLILALFLLKYVRRGTRKLKAYREKRTGQTEVAQRQ